MRIISFNLNGIRSAANKGALKWLAEQEADVICLQEIRASQEILQQALYQLPGYYCYYQPAQKNGYSGVGILTRHAPQQVVRTLGFPVADEEGRYIHLEFGDLRVASLYMPSGTSGEERQSLKYVFMDQFETILDQYLNSGQPYIVCGDWNIAHKIIDIKNWRSNQKHSGFLPQERAWLDKIFDQKGWVDAFRLINQEPDQYTWWSARGRARQNNVGWRIDYQVVTPNLKSAIRQVNIYKEEYFSDHAPLVIDYDYPITGMAGESA